MTDPSKQSNPEFIDVASDSIQFTLYQGDVLPVEKTVKNAQAIQDTECKATDCASSKNPYTEINPRRMRCTECPKFSAETEEQLLRHVRKVHRGENPFQCYMCDYSTYNKCLFEEHVRIHQGIKPFKCSHCPYRSVSKKNTKKHELIHRPDNPHKCRDCGFIARHRRALRCHLKEHNIDVKLTECDICKKKIGDCEAHKKSGITCTLCNNVFCSKYLLKRHMIDMHNEIPKTANSDFVCAICKWRSNIRPRILLHLIHHPDQPVDSNIVDVQILKLCGIKGPGW